jgi:hypothetical protein
MVTVWGFCVFASFYPSWPSESDVPALDVSALAARSGATEISEGGLSDANVMPLVIPFWERHRLAGARLQVFRYALAWWLAPAIFVYAFGVGLGWTLRGFQEQGPPAASRAHTGLTRHDWWIGIVLVAGAILVHAAVPRYEWQHEQGLVWSRIDRWTGEVRRGTLRSSQSGLRWVAR